MNKLTSVLTGILIGAVSYFYLLDVQALVVKWFPFGWFISLTGYIVLILIMFGLFLLTKIIHNRIASFVISTVAYFVISLVLFSLFFPIYVFY